ncbi:GTP cyclohydrolase MptA [Methanothermus fervidus DSM 2088]|uniref:GTP cyclohydrolase MptA n=1 Tax=Methanothermus fervidus (strain ATCC 43054 / DSM 2088 / JCM 10308 / V24 S) TaxID=523846 RepID=E3GY17_METFV|nr:GTP cyclohydrolase MptA [Methanothermus fervidus]ADP77199.1 GTP cyclohydrolase MptA [Methanothermus fervidus DSM 2088]
MSTCFPDTQNELPKIPISLTRVGVTGVKKLVKIERKNKRPIIMLPVFNAFVDLPSSKRGIHMSRNPEAISEVIEEAVNGINIELESLCAKIASLLLKKHKYAQRAEVNMESDFAIVRRTPVTNNKSQEMVKIIANAVGFRNGNDVKIRKMIGAEVTGITVCPCAQELLKELNKQRLLKFLDENTVEKVMKNVTVASHNQRSRGTIMIEVPENYEVRGEDIIEIIESSMSSPVYELLKRPDESKVVEMAHKKPMFVEDSVREMLYKIVEKFSYLPDNTIVTVRQVNEESIHQHNAFAERVATLQELRYEINKNKEQ